MERRELSKIMERKRKVSQKDVSTYIEWIAFLFIAFVTLSHVSGSDSFVSSDSCGSSKFMCEISLQLSQNVSFLEPPNGGLSGKFCLADKEFVELKFKIESIFGSKKSI